MPLNTWSCPRCNKTFDATRRYLMGCGQSHHNGSHWDGSCCHINDIRVETVAEAQARQDWESVP